MAFIPGRNASIYIYDATGACQSFSGRANSAQLRTMSENTETTGFGDSDQTFLNDGIMDWEFTGEGYYDSTANQVDATLFGIHYTASGHTLVRFGPGGSESGSVMYAACGMLTDYKMDFDSANAARASWTIVARSGSLSRQTFA